MTPSPSPTPSPAPPSHDSPRAKRAEKVLGLLTALLTFATAVATIVALFANQAKNEAVAVTQETSNDLASLQTEFDRLRQENRILADENAELRTQLGVAPSESADRPVTPVGTSITRFEIDPTRERMTGPNSYGGGGVQFRAQFIIQNVSGDIDECTITSSITNTQSGETFPQSPAPCPSNSFNIGRFLETGTYRVEAEVYVPEDGATATDSFEFTVS